MSDLEKTLGGITSLGDTAANFIKAAKGEPKPPAVVQQKKTGFPVWGYIAIAAGVVLVVVAMLRK